MNKVTNMMIQEWNLLRKIFDFDFRIDISNLTSVMAVFRIESEIIQRIRTL